ncbi:hypothetical protein [Streptomyces sp. NPDC007083]|uniref:hypothetical protein n=1 Tax=Streptomyces sp. NPDC007083 TaxID=3156913 RepID=UPI0033EAB33B
MTDRPHGYARYKLDGCRCYTCGFAVAEYRDARDHAIRRGTWQPYVDAEPARIHLRKLLACGMGTRTIAEFAQLNRKNIHALLHGRPERGTPPPAQVRPATVAAILAVEPTWQNLPGKTPIAAVGTLRHLRALTAGGWPQSRLGPRLDMTPSNFWALLAREQVTVTTARRVRGLYDDLWRADPRDHGVDNQAYGRARNHARTNQWAPVGTWDDDTIDDPQAYPNWTGHCGTPRGYNAHYSNRILPVCQPCRDARRAHLDERKAVTA